MIYDNLPRPFFALAPMDDVTDTVFRQIVAGTAAPDLYYTEFVNVDGLQSPGRSRLIKKLQFTNREVPLIAQIWGINPKNFYEVSRQIADGTLARKFGLPKGVNYSGIDLNMGCPVKAEVRAGACSALMNNRPLASEIIEATIAGAKGSVPVSVKTRLGFNEVDYTWHEFLLGFGLAALTIHCRTRKQMSKVPADWAAIAKIRKLRDKLAPETLLIGNGDVQSRQQGLELASKYGLDGVMIGRGVFHDPFVFSMSGSEIWQTYDTKSKISLYKNHVELFDKTWHNGERPVPTLNKFCKIYISDFDGAKEMREELMACKSVSELIKILTAALA